MVTDDFSRNLFYSSKKIDIANPVDGYTNSGSLLLKRSIFLTCSDYTVKQAVYMRATLKGADSRLVEAAFTTVSSLVA